MQGNSKVVATRVADKSVQVSTVGNQNSVMGIWDDRAGNIYTAIYSSRLIKKFTPAGKEEVIYKSSFLWAPSGGMIARNGDLWVLEGSIMNDVRVVKVTFTGNNEIF